MPLSPESRPDASAHSDCPAAPKQGKMSKARDVISCTSVSNIAFVAATKQNVDQLGLRVIALQGCKLQLFPSAMITANFHFSTIKHSLWIYHNVLKADTLLTYSSLNADRSLPASFQLQMHYRPITYYVKAKTQTTNTRIDV